MDNLLSQSRTEWDQLLHYDIKIKTIKLISHKIPPDAHPKSAMTLKSCPEFS